MQIPEQLRKVSEELDINVVSQPITVRTLLSWFDAQRRGYFVVQNIREVLFHLGLTTIPDFESAYIDSYVNFKRVEPAEVDAGPIAEIPEMSMDDFMAEVNVDETASYISGAHANPTYQIRRLEAANRPPLAVKPDQELAEAVMLMTMNDYSQLPIMQNERTVKGMISWTSIGKKMTLGQTPMYVRDCLEPAYEVRFDESLFSAISRIVQHGYVLVRDASNQVSGIVTTSDLSVQLRQLAEPFMLIGEIENYIRRIIDGKFTATELAAIRDPADSGREIERVSDLTFGDYLRLLQNQERWARLNFPIPKNLFIAYLDSVRLIRNDVMHFDPDGLPEDQLERLLSFVRLLRTLHETGAIA